MHVNYVNNAQSLIHQLQGRQEVSSQGYWLSRFVRYIRGMIPFDSINFFSQNEANADLPTPQKLGQKSQSLIRKVASAALEFLSEPKGIEIAKQLVFETLKRFDDDPDERHHLLLLKEIEIRLGKDQIEEAKRLVSCIKEVDTLDQTAEILADELRQVTFASMEQKSHDLNSFIRLVQIIENLNSPAKERARLYRFMFEQDANFPKCSSEPDQKAKRHHFLLRMAKSLSSLDEKEFPGLKPFEGLAMIIEDLDAYLEKNPTSEMAKTAKKTLLYCRSLTLEGDMAERLSRDEKNPVYLDIYYSDLRKEIQDLQENQELLLLGGSFDHAILHSVQHSCKRFKTFNSGLGVSKHRLMGKELYQTQIIDNLAKNQFSTDFLKSIFSAKLVDVSTKSDEAKRELSNKQIEEIYLKLRQLSDKRPARLLAVDDPVHSHRMQPHNTCLRNIYLMWLREDVFKDEYHAFKISFSEKALKDAEEPDLIKIGQEKLLHRQKKVLPSS